MKKRSGGATFLSRWSGLPDRNVGPPDIFRAIKMSENHQPPSPAAAPVSSWSRMISGRWVPLFGLFAVFGLLFLEAVSGRTAIFPAQDPEFITQWYPYRVFLRAAYQAHEFPLWCPNLMCGFPFAAFPHAAAFYPLNLFFILGSYAPASTWFHLLHFLLLSAFMFGLSREWGASRLSSWLVALGFALSGPIFYQMRAAHDFATFTWLPGVFWLSLRLARRGRLSDFTALAFLFALFYLAGNVEIALFSLLILLVFITLAVRPPGRRLAAAALAWVMGLLLASAQFLLTLPYLEHSYRSLHAPGIHDYFSANVAAILASALFPANPLVSGGQSAYLGLLIPLGIALSASDPRNQRARKVFLGIAAAVIVYALNLWPCSYLFDRLPLLGSFSAPGLRHRALYGLLALLAMLAAAGLDRLRAGLEPRDRRRGLVLLIVFAAFQLLWLGLGFSRNHGLFPGSGSRLLLLLLIAAFAFHHFRAARKSPGIPWRAGPAWLLIIIGVDLFALHFQTWPRGDESVCRLPVAIPELERLQGPDRAHMITPYPLDLYLWKLARLDRGPGFLFGNIRNGIKNQQEILRAMNRGETTFFRPDFVTRENQPLLDFLAVKYLFVRRAPDSAPDPLNHRPIYRQTFNYQNEFMIYQNQQSLDLFGFYTRARELWDPETLAALQNPSAFAPSRELLLAPGQGALLSSSEPARERKPGDVNVVQLAYTSRRLSLTAPAPGYLSIASTYYPGWRAYVDGRETRVLRANYAFQALALPTPGPQQVTLAFVPEEFRIGLWVSLASLLAAALTMANNWKWKKQP